jgi:hypothetical protein
LIATVVIGVLRLGIAARRLIGKRRSGKGKHRHCCEGADRRLGSHTGSNLIVLPDAL